MTAHNCLCLIAIVFAVIGWGSFVYADADVTVIRTSEATAAPSQKTVSSDGTPVVHKSLHKKKQTTTAKATGTGAGVPSTPPAAAANTASATAENKSAQQPVTVAVVEIAHPQATAAAESSPAAAPANTTSDKSALISNPATPVPTAAASPATLGPTVETGLPVAHYSGIGSPIKGVSTYIPTTATAPAHQTIFANTLPSSVVPMVSSPAGTYSSPNRTTSPPSDFVFTNFSKKTKVTYPWKTGIITTMFWIGEGGSTISSTDNIGSAWDEHWRSSNRGSDNPNDRNGYSPADHAPTVNPFYVALPFNDLAFPDKARQWLPSGWYRRPKDGKQVSACKDRWVEIKNAQGRPCYAQWEDVGPLRYDHAEYVFGSERPDTYTRAGLDVSPAVAQYLDIDGNKRAITSWRFVEDEDVPPGAWLKYDEQAVIYTALHQLKTSSPSTDLPIQKATEPIEDPQNIDSNKKKVDASKG